ncbi:hypothetical protein GCK72_022103 [Caenorhabditis remanei]|uniref:Uncharacterized protein n=1 Tax=Caenorhabditis remanei TaxID=31234 RepID=A0A6A5FT40_CAERE|nr:hypothetical protein GCK72_022103 [Caenorhabditis remanei]KAF1745656.1 hypothetical protein GCK72_022103 [Caenorhabditis remanei]
MPLKVAPAAEHREEALQSPNQLLRSTKMMLIQPMKLQPLKSTRLSPLKAATESPPAAKTSLEKHKDDAAPSKFQVKAHEEEHKEETDALSGAVPGAPATFEEHKEEASCSNCTGGSTRTHSETRAKEHKEEATLSEVAEEGGSCQAY